MIRAALLHHDWTAALVSGWVSFSTGRIVAATTGDTGLGLWAQLGVAGLIVVAIMFMLRRSDRREAAKDTAIAEIESARIADLKAQIKVLQQELQRRDTP